MLRKVEYVFKVQHLIRKTLACELFSSWDQYCIQVAKSPVSVQPFSFRSFVFFPAVIISKLLYVHFLLTIVKAKPILKVSHKS